MGLAFSPFPAQGAYLVHSHGSRHIADARMLVANTQLLQIVLRRGAADER